MNAEPRWSVVENGSSINQWLVIKLQTREFVHEVACRSFFFSLSLSLSLSFYNLNMSSLYSIESEEGLAFDNRTSNANFQERLLEAQLQQNTNQSNAIVVRLSVSFSVKPVTEL